MNYRFYRQFILLGLTLFLFGCAKENTHSQLSIPPINYKSNQVNFSEFAGTKECKSCHPDIFSQWASSTHGKAGGPPTNERVIAPFNGDPIQFADATVFPEKKDGVYQFRLINNISNNVEIIRIEAVVGGGFIYGGGTQTFFAQYPDGTYRFLPFDYSESESSWFVQLTSNEEWVKVTPEIGLDDLYNWPAHRVLGEIENLSNCQQCHGSQIIGEKIGERYQVEFTSLAVNCESCHGPAKTHIKTMSGIVKQIVSESETTGIKSLVGISPEESLNLCFQCHAVKTPLKGGYLPGEKLEEFYSLKMSLLGNKNPYSIDGRITTFAYQQNHLYSDCFLSGTMTCISCHNPHSNDYQDINRVALLNRFDDNQCLSCHMAKSEDIKAHTFHSPESEGSRCISCHMPFRQHRAIGDEIKYTRSDHTVSIPRPAYDQSQGFESACVQCHEDQTVTALQQTVDQWYGPVKPLHPVIANRLAVTEATFGSDAANLLLQPALKHPMGQFANLSYFIKRYLTPGMDDLASPIVEKIMTYAKSDDIDIKALALAGLHYSQYQNPKIQKFIKEELKEMGDQEEAIRRRWGLILDYFGTVFYLSGDRPRAITCFELALAVLPDDNTIKDNLNRARS